MTFASCFNLGPQVTQDYTLPKHAFNATNRLGGKFVSVASCAAAKLKTEAADSVADEHYAKIAQERRVPRYITHAKDALKGPPRQLCPSEAREDNTQGNSVSYMVRAGENI